MTVAFTDGSFSIWKLVPPEPKAQTTVRSTAGRSSLFQDEVLISLDSAEQPRGPLMIAEVNDKKVHYPKNDETHLKQ